ncbi:hypothetical protein BDW42DRAFT_165321 [Aspergillus taichungensis]|uniref:Uncharacterized protein n=1 Tax=Aspergillus taichungensis TaxID=482145 RepID=A0A2J5I0E3_9EURO|nr:hypothetical protein BDW42DRAFT_165321 [Aspergillus taichungensis]
MCGLATTQTALELSQGRHQPAIANHFFSCICFKTWLLCVGLGTRAAQTSQSKLRMFWLDV